MGMDGEETIGEGMETGKSIVFSGIYGGASLQARDVCVCVCVCVLSLIRKILYM